MWSRSLALLAVLGTAGLPACDYGETDGELEQLPETEVTEEAVPEEVQIAPESEPPEPGATDTL